MYYRGRPGLSPATAALVASGVLGRGARLLDAGCGHGEESLALAALGFNVIGVDRDEVAVRTAQRLAVRRGLDPRPTFVRGQVEDIAKLFGPASFDAVVDVLVYNNVRWGEGGSARRAGRYVHGVADVLRSGGIYVVQWRLDPAARYSERALLADLPRRALDRFEPARPVQTHLPVTPEKRGGRGYAAVGLAVLRRR